ncbi:MAG: dTDP-glucose 4,6-dehydratase, partial [uncultured Pseudonocardia sp.]
ASTGDRRGRVHRLPLRAHPAHRGLSGVRRRRGGRAGRAHLRRHADQPRAGARLTAPAVRPGRHPGRGRGRRGGAGRRRGRALRRGVARRPLHHRRRGLRLHQRRGHPGAAAGRARRGRGSVRARQHGRGVRLDRDRLLAGDAPAGAELALLGVQGILGPAGAVLPPHARSAGLHHALLQQLRAAPVPGEGHPAVRHQPARRRHRAALRRGRQRAGLAVRRRPLPRPAGGPGEGCGRRGLQHRRRHRADQPGADRAPARGDRPGLVGGGADRRPARRRARLPLLGRLVEDRRPRLRAADVVRRGPRPDRRVVPGAPGLVGTAEGPGV